MQRKLTDTNHYNPYTTSQAVSLFRLFSLGEKQALSVNHQQSPLCNKAGFLLHCMSLWDRKSKTLFGYLPASSNLYQTNPTTSVWSLVQSAMVVHK